MRACYRPSSRAVPPKSPPPQQAPRSADQQGHGLQQQHQHPPQHLLQLSAARGHAEAEGGADTQRDHPGKGGTADAQGRSARRTRPLPVPTQPPPTPAEKVGGVGGCAAGW